MSGLRFCRNVGEVLARIVYTLAFKAPSTANDTDYKHFKKHCVCCEDGRFISGKSGVDTWINRGASCVPKRADRQTDSMLSINIRIYAYIYAYIYVYVYVYVYIIHVCICIYIIFVVE